MATVFSAQYYFGLRNVPGISPPAQSLDPGPAFAFTITASPATGRPRTCWYTLAPQGCDIVVPPLALILANTYLVPAWVGECRSEQDREPDQFGSAVPAQDPLEVYGPMQPQGGRPVQGIQVPRRTPPYGADVEVVYWTKPGHQHITIKPLFDWPGSGSYFRIQFLGLHLPGSRPHGAVGALKYQGDGWPGVREWRPRNP
jgi:hypothetical protein